MSLGCFNARVTVVVVFRTRIAKVRTGCVLWLFMSFHDKGRGTCTLSTGCTHWEILCSGCEHTAWNNVRGVVIAQLLDLN